MNNRQLEVQVQEYLFEDDGRIPNNPNLPLLLYPRVLYEAEQQPSRSKELLEERLGRGLGRRRLLLPPLSLYLP